MNATTHWASFKVTPQESRLINKIAARAVKLAESNEVETDFIEMSMDITACHANGCRLDLEKMLAASDGDFGHDAFGIRRYIDRKTGELTDCFLPRCAARE
jgi:hypothetical protein